MKLNRRDLLKLAGVAGLSSIIPGRKVLKAFDGSCDKGKGGHAYNQWESASDGANVKRFAMIVNLKKCWEEGKGQCDDCIQACHNIHNVPKIKNFKHEIKWIWKEPMANAFPSRNHEHVSNAEKRNSCLVLCNHCDNPPCVRVCPTKATFQREKDRIVMMDQHRCIGCRYCMAACPYGARSFNFKDPRPEVKNIDHDYPTRTMGVVEKCTFCSERLADGHLPKCVVACPHLALTFGDLKEKDSKVREILQNNNVIRRKPHLGTSPEVFYII